MTTHSTLKMPVVIASQVIVLPSEAARWSGRMLAIGTTRDRNWPNGQDRYDDMSAEHNGGHRAKGYGSAQALPTSISAKLRSDLARAARARRM
jgi:hypothetical protein